MTETDKNGTEIRAGDTIHNPYDRDGYHIVIADADGKLYLGDYDSPLDRYQPHLFWAITSRVQKSDPAGSAL